ncbi:hypothetical protein POV27_09235 [Aureisphaera galaxeae]|nr:hypothetical protein [Aureisphaera galaxeae]MDC8004233.1 hypothetical protein [Aureisphaera galaxeae]
MTKRPKKKTHADFQSRYRRSFNFRRSSKNDKLVLNENGELVLVKNEQE